MYKAYSGTEQTLCAAAACRKTPAQLGFCVYIIKWFWVMKDAGTRKNGSWCHRDCRYREFGSQGPSVDPVVLFKMVLIQHLYGVPSLRRTADEISTNICCRWFLGYTLQEETSHFSTVSYNFRHRFTAETVDQVFAWILEEVAEAGYLSSKAVFIDGTHIKTNANTKKRVKAAIPAASKHYAKELMEEVNADREARGKKPFEDDDEPPKPPKK